jgi:LPXTG-site transpeptidase (sortase) family protein
MPDNRSMRGPMVSLAGLTVAAFAIMSAGCGDPGAKVRSLAAPSATEASPVPQTGFTETPSTEATGDADTATTVPAEETPLPTSARTEPLTTATADATTEVEPVATKPPPCRVIAFSSGNTLTAADLEARGRGQPVRKPFLGVDLVIRRIGVDAGFVVRTVGPDGAMPRVGDATDVAWYDFSQWPGLGGTPGTDHGNVIVAGDYDDNNVPQAVFYRLSELARGDLIQINTSDGRTLAYEVEFNKVTAVDAVDWTDLVASTPEESITLITAAAPMNQGRRIVWGRALDTGCSH